EYEIRVKQTLTFLEWKPNHSSGVSVEKARSRFVCSSDFKIRYKESNFLGTVVTGTDDSGNSTYTWEISGLKAYRDEPYSPDAEAYLPVVRIAAENFSYPGINGSFSNWQEYGRWTYENLLKGRDAIPEATAYHIRNLVENIADPKQKAKKIYEFVQQKTRYVGIQIGIGGFQPMSATEVDQLGYGDCKGLVNYTQALL